MVSVPLAATAYRLLGNEVNGEAKLRSSK